MKKFKFIVVAAILASTISLTSCTSLFEFENVKTTDNDISIDRGNSFQTVQNNDIAVSLHGKNVEDESEACIVAGIRNKSRVGAYQFNDSNVTVYEGNVDTDKWNKILNWDASSYYKEAKSEAASREFFQAVSGVLNVANASWEAQSSEYSTTNTDVLITSLVENQKMRNIVDADQHQLSFLEDNLLYNSDIRANETYNGVFFFPVNNDYPDYKVTYADNYSKPLDFYFNRSDRAEILNPWLDQSRPRFSLVVEQAPSLEVTSLTMHYSKSKGLGYYNGLDFYYMTKDNSTSLTATDKPKLFGFGYSFGGNIKVAPYSWLFMGFDVAYGKSIVSLDNSLANTADYTKDANHAYSDMNYDIGLQIGLNTIVNFIDLNAKATWMFNHGFYGQVGLGYAF